MEKPQVFSKYVWHDFFNDFENSAVKAAYVLSCVLCYRLVT